MLRRVYPLLTAIGFSLFLIGCSDPATEVPAQAPTEAPEQWRQAAVAMPDRYGAEVGETILAAGGNAVDAAVAAGFALAVTFPEAGNIGGGGFMLIHMNGENLFVDYREKAPLAADRDMYLDENGDVIPDASLIGHLSVGVPGTVAGFWAAHQKYGSLPGKTWSCRLFSWPRLDSSFLKNSAVACCRRSKSMKGRPTSENILVI